MNRETTTSESITMPPNQTTHTIILETNTRSHEDQLFYDDDLPKSVAKKPTVRTDPRNQPQFEPEIKWLNVIAIGLFHFFGVVLFPIAAIKMKILTHLWMLLYGLFSGFGVTAGAHRLWSHRAYKAKLPLKIILLTAYAAAGMNSLFDWVRDHRVHHKYSETDADPHNSKRGFFFSHVGWLLQKKHPEVSRRGKTLDFTDITEDPLLKFYNKYFLVFKIFLCFILPVIIPVYFWNETWFYSFVSQALFRYMGSLNSTWAVNSFAHIWGQRPYDSRIRPVENYIVAIAALGEGWHNYHHVFPWDYKAAELGNYKYNITTMLLDFFARIGWAYDLKAPSAELVQKYIEKYGDGSYGSKEIPFKDEYTKKE